MTKTILQTLNSGGSPHGLHSYMAHLDCPEKARLQAQLREDPDHYELERPGALTRGTIGHAFMEMHFGQRLPVQDNTTLVEFDHACNLTAREDAEKAFTAFREAFPDPEYFGRVVGVEMPLPASEKDAARVEEAVGISPYTARVDLLTRIRQKDIARLDEGPLSGITECLEPGYWIVDHKFLGARPNVDEALSSMQYVAYPLAAQAQWPKWGIKGTIQNTVICTKETRFEHVVIPFPGQEEVRTLHQMWHTIAAIMEQEDSIRFNIKRCYDWRRQCEFKQNGMCRRY